MQHKALDRHQGCIFGGSYAIGSDLRRIEVSSDSSKDDREECCDLDLDERRVRMLSVSSEMDQTAVVVGCSDLRRVPPESREMPSVSSEMDKTAGCSDLRRVPPPESRKTEAGGRCELAVDLGPAAVWGNCGNERRVFRMSSDTSEMDQTLSCSDLGLDTRRVTPPDDRICATGG